MASARESDYVDVAKNYARKVVRDKKRNRHCFRTQQAAQRFLDDLARARKKTCPFLFDRSRANDVCSFIEKLPHVEGVWDKPTITLHESQCFFLVQQFGFRKREPVIIDGEEFRPPRFSSALYKQPTARIPVGPGLIAGRPREGQGGRGREETQESIEGNGKRPGK